MTSQTPISTPYRLTMIVWLVFDWFNNALKITIGMEIHGWHCNRNGTFSSAPSSHRIRTLQIVQDDKQIVMKFPPSFLRHLVWLLVMVATGCQNVRVWATWPPAVVASPTILYPEGDGKIWCDGGSRLYCHCVESGDLEDQTCCTYFIESFR